MKENLKQPLKNYLKIYNAAVSSEDGNRSIVSPHPDLKKKILAEIKKLKSTTDKSVIANKIRIADETRPGLNDGLIYPGILFPLGTSINIARSAGLNKTPPRGTIRAIVVLVDFSDKVMVQTRQHYEDLLFSLGVIPTGSVREYFREVSNNLIDIQGEVVGPFRMPDTLHDYAHGASGMGGVSPNARTMAYDAAVAANPTVNFTQYDNDNDGYVDAFIVIHAGVGAETNNNPDDIWSHKWTLAGGAYTADGSTKIYTYSTVPEDCNIGVVAHELGHALLGFPDLYDTDYSSEGVGNWCLMGAGSWGNGGLTPTHPSAWCKCNQEWVTIDAPTANKSHVTIEDVKSGYKVFKLWKDGAASTEYFLVENRQKDKFDKYLPGGGLLIWHIDDAISSNSNEAHYRVALEQADNKNDLEHGTNRGDAGDCYPGTANNSTFDNSSSPNSKSYAGANTCVAVKNISAAGAIMYADLNVKCIMVKIPKDLKDFKKELKKEILKERYKEIKEHIKEIKEHIKEIKEKEIKEFKEKEKDIYEHKNVDIGGGLTQVSLPSSELPLEQRVAYLESILASIQPFISGEMRPDVGVKPEETESDNQ